MTWPLRLSKRASRGIPNALIMAHNFTRRNLSSYLVTPKELSDALATNPTKDSTIVPLCASWFLPNDPEQRTGISVFRKQRIPTARFFDLDAVKDQNSPYPHMLPNAADFAHEMAELGIRREDAIVVYDSAELGIFSAPRVAWTLNIFGHDRVHLLNSFKAWVDQGYPTTSGESEPVARSAYPVPTLDAAAVVGFDEVKEVAASYRDGTPTNVQILDARPSGRWAGTLPEPRPELSSGHIPGSLSVPFSDLLDPASKNLLPKEELRRVFQAKGVDPTKKIISSCGTGVTAAVIDAALKEAGYDDRQLYDGSWTSVFPRSIGLDEIQHSADNYQGVGSTSHRSRGLGR